MYTILDKAELLSFDEIKAKYDGKWVFMTNCEFTDGNGLICAIPRIIADKKFSGFDDGIYSIYDDEEIYGESTHFSFYDVGCFIGSISFVSKGVETVETSSVLV
jgi:hypothetical protein